MGKRTLFLFLAACVLFVTPAFAQLMEENFNYSTGQLTSSGSGANVSGGNWVGFSGSGFYIQVGPGSLSFPSYTASGIGNSISITSTSSSAEDVYRQFAAQPVGGSVYAAFLLSVKDTTGLAANSSANGDYFFALLPSTSTSTYVDRLVIRKGASGSTYQLGLRITSSNASAVWSTTDRDTGTTYLVVLKYQLNSGSANDVGSLWINPSLAGGEPTADVTQTSALASEPSDIARTAIRQGGLTTPNAIIDGIRVGLTWGGTILNQPVAAFSTHSLVFGNVNVNSSKQGSVTVRNIGSTTLNITDVASSDPTFVPAPTSTSIAPLDSSSFTVTFTPVATGDKSTTIVFSSNTAAVTDTVNATGSGVQAGFNATPTALAFGNVFKDSTKTDTITVSNASNAVQLVIDSVRSNNALFTVSPTSGVVDTSSSMKFAVTFAPLATGAESGSVVFYHNAPSLHDTVKVSGTGIVREPLFSASKTTVAFPHILVGTSKSDSVLVKNVGFDSLLISNVTSTSGEFVVTPTQARLDTGASQMFLVTYTASDTLPVSASLVFAHNGSKGADTVKATGAGGLRVLTIAEARIDANQDFRPDLLGDTVVVIGVVNSINVQGSNSFTGYFIQDSTGGVEIFAYALGQPLSPGYRVRVTGVVAYYRGTTEITPANVNTDIVILDSNNVITPIPLTIGQLKANPEFYENRRIRLNVVAPLFTSSSWPIAGNAANLNIWDGKDTLTLRVENESNVGGSPFPNFPVALTGTVTQFTSSATVYNNGYQITPNYISDFVPINAPPLATFHLLSPVNDSAVVLNDTAQVTLFTWEPALDFNGDTLTYHLVPIGHSPVPAENNGKSTEVTARGKDLLPFLGAQDTVTVKWTVTANDGVNPDVGSVDTLNLRLIRGTIQGVKDRAPVPKVYALEQNFPNPFNPSATIQYALPQASRVSLKVYSILGQEVRTLVEDVQPASFYSVVWDGTNGQGVHVTSGVYFYRITAEPVSGKDAKPFVMVKKMMLLK